MDNRQRSRRKKEARRGARKLLIGQVLSLAFFFCGIAMVLYAWDGRYAEEQPVSAGSVLGVSGGEAEEIEYRGRRFALKKDLETFLIIGVDKYLDTAMGSVQGEYEQADVLLLLVADHSKQRYTILHINRDTMCDVTLLTSDGKPFRVAYQQIALSHTYGGDSRTECENTADAVSHLMGEMGIDHYLSITMDGLIALNDLIGGVTLTAQADIGDTIKKGEDITLRGADALLYVRQRMGVGDSSNLQRMERQRQYLEAFQWQFNKKMAEDSSFLMSVLVDLNPYIVSNATLSQISNMAETLNRYQSDGYLPLPGEAVVGKVYMEYHVDEEALQELILSLFYTENTEG